MKNFLVVVCAGAGLAWAQGGGPVFEKQITLQGDPGTTKAFVLTEMGPEKVVKNAPYSAQMVTEMTQVLVDGNRIQHKTSATVQRDSEGRTRNEVGSAGEPATVFIRDPVAGLNYVLDPKTKTARKFGGVVGGVPGGVGGGVGGGVIGGIISGGSGTRIIEYRQTKKTESQKRLVEPLGTRTIEGVPAEGTRTTVTIPAGQIGNEKPIEVVTEQWYSPQLQTTVLTKTSDPRMGETVLRLTNISLAEPPHSAFEVPSDYTVEQRK